MTPTEQETDPRATEVASELVTYAARLVRQIRRRHDVPAGTRILSVVEECGPIGISALAEVDRSSQPTMSTAVSALTAAGLLDKQPKPGDGRSSVVTLTDAGRADLARFRAAYGATISARLARTSHTAEDVATAVAVLRDVVATADL